MEWHDQFPPNVWHPMPIPDGAHSSVSLVGAIRDGGTSYCESRMDEDDKDVPQLGTWVKNGKLNRAGVEESDWIWYPATHWLWRNVPDIPTS